MVLIIALSCSIIKIQEKEEMAMGETFSSIFHKEDGSYWVEFPDLPGCHTYGGSIEETTANAYEALSGYLASLSEQNADNTETDEG